MELAFAPEFIEKATKGSLFIENVITYTEKYILYIRNSIGNAVSPPQIQLAPAYIDVSEYAPAQAECRASSASPVNYTWVRLNGEVSADTWIQQGLLRFNLLRRSDAGEYRCIARNEYGEDSRILNVFVREDRPRPPMDQLVIHPSQFSGRSGDVVLLVCQDRANRNAAVRWHNEARPESISNAVINNGELVIPRASPEDSGRYMCISSENSSVFQTVDVYISSGHDDDGRAEPPKIEKLNDLYTVIQGTDFSLACKVSGKPIPSIKWAKVHETIDANVRVIGNILKISNAQPRNRGVYSCVAESNGDIVEDSTVIDIERKYE